MQVPVVRRRDRHGIDILVFQKLADINNALNPPAGRRLELFGPFIEDVNIHVA